MLNFKAQSFQWKAGRLLPVEMDHLIFKKSTIHYFQNTYIYIYMYTFIFIHINFLKHSKFKFLKISTNEGQKFTLF